jgi:hypothetical protein
MGDVVIGWEARNAFKSVISLRLYKTSSYPEPLHHKHLNFIKYWRELMYVD